MADASKITVNGETYNVKDPTARNAASAAQATADGKLSDALSDGKEYLRKNGEWVEPSGGGSGVPDGGTIGQVLAKRSNTDGDAGWYNLRHLPYDKWYLVDGITEDNVIAAYQFVGMNSEADALVNVNDGIEYGLTKSSNNIRWNPETGIFMPAESLCYLNNTTLQNRFNDIVTAAYGFSVDDIQIIDPGQAVIGGLLLNRARRLTIGSFGADVNAGCIVYFPSINIGDGYNGGNYAVSNYSHPVFFTHGVLAGDWSDTTSVMFINGISRSISSANLNNAALTVWDGFYVKGVLTQPNKTYGDAFFVSYNINAIAFYNIKLSSSQHAELSENIHALGGIE